MKHLFRRVEDHLAERATGVQEGPLIGICRVQFTANVHV